IMGTGSARIADLGEGKVRACIDFVVANRAMVRSFMLSATKQDNAAASTANEAIDKLLELLGVFVADLSGAYSSAHTAAHWFKANNPPIPTPAFADLLAGLDSVLESLRNASISSPASLLPDIEALCAEAKATTPVASKLTAAATSLATATIAAMGAGLPAAVASDLLGGVAKANSSAATLGSLTLAAPLPQLRF